MMLDPILEYTSTGSNREVHQLSRELLVGLAYYKARQLGKKYVGKTPLFFYCNDMNPRIMVRSSYKNAATIVPFCRVKN